MISKPRERSGGPVQGSETITLDPCRHAAFLIVAALALSFASTGCHSAMNTSAAASAFSRASSEFPLKFKQHNFETYCYNTLKCKVVYNNVNFTRVYEDSPSGPPPSPDYREKWGFASNVGVRNFPPPAEVQWTSLDGVEHAAKVDIGEIFKDELVLHKVPESDYAERSFGDSPSIFIEINDRTISVFMMAYIATKTEQVPGNKHSTHRYDLVLAWSKTY